MIKPELQPASHFVGRWLRSRANPDLGFGYCKEKRGDSYVLSYVDIPEVAEHEVLVEPSDLIDRSIPNGTRVWVRGAPYGWHAGEIKMPASTGRYHVALVGVPRQILLYQDQFYLRWSKPLADPSAALQHGLSEAPVFHEARSDLLAALVRQRQVSRGLSGVVSAPVSLYHHQIDTVARVLADPVIRYLLADEVGLGKTIEAGLVIRQVMIDDPDAEVLVLVPDSLVGQWRSELHGRLALGPALEDQRLVVMSHEQLGHQWNLDHVALVVIDEAHNLLDRILDGSATHQALLDAPALLALSATPMRGDLGVFRRLLALVDPVAFGSITEESFLQRLNERERSAGELQLLNSRRASARQKRGVVDSLLEMFAGDLNIVELAAACADVEDNLAPAWTELAEYIRETYRLSRRMIRHRREGDLTDGYAVAGRKPTYVELHDAARADADEFLDLLRFELEAGRHEDLYAQAVLHALAGPRALLTFLRDRAALPAHSPKAPPEAVRALFESTAAHLEIAGIDARIDAAIAIAQERVGRGCKVVVSSSFAAIAHAFEERILEEIDEFSVFHHYSDMHAHVRDNAVADFLNAASGVVLVADRSMEEGRNLQEAEVLINLDLPLDASRLDQRIGRLDRYAVRPEPAEVVVLVEPNSPWVTAQIRLLGEGTGVFDSSVSTVQRMLTEVLDKVRGELLARGVGALDLDVSALRAELNTERDDIELLEEMESVSAAVSFGHEAFAELLEYEGGDDDPLRQAVKRLTQGTGSLGMKPVESKDGVIRFGGAKEIGLPEDQIPALHSLLLAPKTYSREVAAERYAVAPFRIGDPLVDWLDDYLRADERGRAYAVVRPVAGLSTPALWVHCEFLVEFDDAHLAWDGAARRRLSRRGDGLFPPVKYETWTDPYGAAPDELMRENLDLPFDSKRDEVVLRGPIWKPVLEEFPAWVELIKQSADQARALVSDSADLAERVGRGLRAAQDETRRRDAILRARSLRLPTEHEREAAQIEFESERAAGTALIAGIERQSIQMTSCGVCVLWPEDNF
ncbi:ATP-dependent helicase HepA [Marmoricola sp. OAE513]|uniref:protein DpdE n=1 Tax=Marmoricola sp. OAE513 TaxID=2817894 RepID=UPI001AE20AA8